MLNVNSSLSLTLLGHEKGYCLQWLPNFGTLQQVFSRGPCCVEVWIQESLDQTECFSTVRNLQIISPFKSVTERHFMEEEKGSCTLDVSVNIEFKAKENACFIPCIKFLPLKIF